MSDDDLVDVQSVQYEHVMIILGQSDHVALAGELEATAAAHFDVRTLELGDHLTFAREHGNVESIAVTVADENVAGVAHVYAVREVGDVLAADAAQIRALLVEHDHTVALEVAHVVLAAAHGYVRWLAHMIRTVEPFNQIASLARYAKYGR